MNDINVGCVIRKKQDPLRWQDRFQRQDEKEDDVRACIPNSYDRNLPVLQKTRSKLTHHLKATF
jgi:hypothetical protein